MVDLETGGVSASKETVPTPTSSASAPAPAQVSAASSTPSPAPAPVKEEPKEEPKEEHKPAPISTPSPGAIPTPAPAPAAADVPVAVKKEIDTVPEVTAKDLEIEQPEEPSDDEQEDKGPLEKVQDSLKSLAVGREEPTKESNGVTAVCSSISILDHCLSLTAPTVSLGSAYAAFKHLPRQETFILRHNSHPRLSPFSRLRSLFRGRNSCARTRQGFD